MQHWQVWSLIILGIITHAKVDERYKDKLREYASSVAQISDLQGSVQSCSRQTFFQNPNLIRVTISVNQDLGYNWVNS